MLSISSLIPVLSSIPGLLCTVAADKCLSSPCNNNATCLDHLGDYVCLCPRAPVWYTGKNCDELFDACIWAPCTNCTSKPGTGEFTCHCPDGFTGQNCSQDVDECQSNPCEGIQSYCVNRVNGYSCHCPLGRGGQDCQENVTTCSEKTCQNGGTCVDIPDIGHMCQCAAGYQGTNCEENIDECLSEPCQNGAICKDGVNAYQCFCVPGFQGYHCDLDINECASRPCQNNGTCLDEVDHYRCDCAPGFTAGFLAPPVYKCDCEGTGFLGNHCEEDIPECASNPCQHGATCLEEINQYKCLCWPGYEGENCQLDRDECEQHPCENGAECFQRSDILNYDKLPEFSKANFSYEEAAGFICRCLPGFTGDNCSVNVDECESAPCQHGGTCQDLVNSYQCVCPDGFTVDHGEKQVDAAAAAVLLLWALVADSYTCFCPPGWTGDRCNTSTTFSFNSEGYIHMQLLSKNRTRRETKDHNRGLHMHLRFRSTLPDMVLFYRGTMERFFSLELVGGSLQARVKSGKVLQVIYPGPVNDGEWHQATVTMDKRLVLVVKGPGCEEECLVKNEGYNHLIFLQPSSFQHLYVGGALQDYLAQTSSGKGFIGCMQDLQVDHKLLLPQDLIKEENQGLEIGCSKNDWCQDDPCMQRGKCVDMWVRPSCLCHRPYYGESCGEEYPSWTFGHENTTSYAGFNISESHGDNFTISFLMRSLKHNGLLLQLHREGKPYLTVYLKEGTVAIYSPHTTLLSEAMFVTDGNNNLVTVKIQYGHVLYPKAGNHRALGNVSVEAGDVVYVGGLPAGKSMNAWGGHFKGCLQDIQLDHKHLTIEDYAEGVEVYQAGTEENVLPGCQSDDTCKDQPCFNGGQCLITWNDFTCNCSINFSGRLCETRLWCIDNPCPDTVRCVDLKDGYECLTEAIFQDNALQYFSNSSLLSPVTNITMDVRTRDKNGILLRAGNRAEVFCIGLLNSSLLVKLNSGASAELLAFTSDRAIADGAWHHIQLVMVNPTQLASRWRLTVDGQRVGGSFGVGGNLNFLNDTKIWLAENYTGCLGEEEVDNCVEFSCVNGGTCVDRLGAHTCSCPPGYVGKRCQWRFPPVACDAHTKCLNGGVCIGDDSGGNCTCKPGYTGARCETEIDECESSPCLNGATCLDRLNHFQCVCLPGFSGTVCDSKKAEHVERIPWLVVTIPLITLCVLLAILVVFCLIMTARKKRQSEGTYSPSSQEVAGARLEMGSVLKVPPEERLI
ncbi:hypothetical protein FQN60_017580 [Etheostoma spectabile]|uniref:Crumbs cell polarity complex component 2b n=1 Tax=Etheostoma spectabile TaxID=54343 RepID=A0A5J5DFJ8_9PERO|nr:hypothetical protein FQN60_017580 [Etheostoma spectabile]